MFACRPNIESMNTDQILRVSDLERAIISYKAKEIKAIDLAKVIKDAAEAFTEPTINADTNEIEPEDSDEQ